ncbi:MAG: hypothetical protein BWK80_17435 [Desulfobacteraceae bacterium IS3]|nr:MAG: hypothetical protein BWK80_17435 [Desulfobacteraceae bacterium IS3]
MCGDCRKHFPENPDIRKIADERKEFTEKMLSEKISPAGICRVPGISESRLQSHVNEKYKHIGVTQLNTAFLKPQSFAKQTAKFRKDIF